MVRCCAEPDDGLVRPKVTRSGMDAMEKEELEEKRFYAETQARRKRQEKIEYDMHPIVDGQVLLRVLITGCGELDQQLGRKIMDSEKVTGVYYCSADGVTLDDEGEDGFNGLSLNGDSADDVVEFAKWARVDLVVSAAQSDPSIARQLETELAPLGVTVLSPDEALALKDASTLLNACLDEIIKCVREAIELADPAALASSVAVDVSPAE